MTVLITGGKGFIGRNFIKYLKKNYNYYIVNIDSLNYVSKDFYEPNSEDVFYKVRIGNNKVISKILKKHQPTKIFNFAAETHVDRSIISPKKFYHNNVTENIYFIDEVRNYILKNNKKIKFIHISTDEVFGHLKKNDTPFSEISRYFPRNPYAASKASCDHLLNSYFQTYKFPSIIVNCSNNFGPYQNKEKLIPKTIYNALKRKNIPIYGKGNQIREWLYVEDNCSAIDLVSKKGVLGESYNIGSGDEMTNIELVKKILLIVKENTNNSYNLERLIKFVPDRLGHDFRYSLNIKKIKKLKWKIHKDFNNKLIKTVNWYINKFSA